MKRTILCLIMLLIPSDSLINNPIVLPKAFISELTFDGSGKWLLEIGFQFSTPYYRQQYDSICLATSNGFSKIRLDNIPDSTAIFVITSDSLMTPLSINTRGDYARLYSFLASPYRTQGIDSLLFCDYPGSTIDSLPLGYSIVRLGYQLFSKDKSPTFGLPNDTVGTCGTLKGHIYDKMNDLVTKGNFILENPIALGSDGAFSTNVYSRRVRFGRITNNFKPNTSQILNIDTLQLNINPECQDEKDIRIVDDIVGVKENRNEPDYDISVMNYPNPFNSSTMFAVTIPSSLKRAKKQIAIYNTLGQKINSIVVSNQLQARWDGKDYAGAMVASGIYYYQLVLDNRARKNGSMILLK